MSDGPTNPEGNETLSNELFGNGFFANVERHLNRARFELKRGAFEQVDEHLARVNKSFIKGIISSPSPHLSGPENEEFILLKQKAYSVNESGDVTMHDLSQIERDRFNMLQRKAHPADEQKTE